MEQYERPIKVNCIKCGYINEKDIEAIDFWEDIQGRDMVKFICPTCGQERTSLRFG